MDLGLNRRVALVAASSRGYVPVDPEARYLVFRAFQNVPEAEPEPKGPGNFYGTVDFEMSYPRPPLSTR